MRVKTILINHSPLFTSATNYMNMVPTNLLSIGSYLKHKEFKDTNCLDVEVVNLPEFFEQKHKKFTIPKSLSEKKFRKYEKNINFFLQQYTDYDNLVFGIACYSANYYLASVLLGLIIRKTYPKSIITIGGYHVNLFPEEFDFPKASNGLNIGVKIFDYKFIGEAEIEFGKLMRTLIFGNKMESNPEEPTRTIFCEPVQDLDALPMIDYSLTNIIKRAPANLVPIFTSRGCPFTCSFCGDYYKKKMFGSLHYRRKMSLPRINQEVMHMSSYFEQEGITYFAMFFDPLFHNSAVRKKIFQGMIDSGFQDDFWFEARPDHYNAVEESQYLKHLNASISFGLESGSPKILNAMNKTGNPEQYLKKFPSTLETMERSGTYAVVNILYGYPSETRETLEESNSFITQAFKDRGNILPFVGKYYLTPGSYDYEHQEDYTEKWGTKFHYPKYWLHGKKLMIRTLVDPSRELDVEGLIQYEAPFIANMYRNSVENLVELKERRSMHDYIKLISENAAAYHEERIYDLYLGYDYGSQPSLEEDLTKFNEIANNLYYHDMITEKAVKLIL